MFFYVVCLFVDSQKLLNGIQQNLDRGWVLIFDKHPDKETDPGLFSHCSCEIKLFFFLFFFFYIIVNFSGNNSCIFMKINPAHLGGRHL